jgi:hypothetical protein
MGIARGLNIIRDGLIYGYDTGQGVSDNETATRFYPGEPTTNEFYGSGSNGNILDHASGYGGYGTAQTGALDAFGTTENTVYRNTGKMRLGPTGGQDIGTLTNGNTYTFSIYLRHVPGENNVAGSSGFEFDIVDQISGGTSYSGTLDSNMTYDWKRFSVTSTHSNNANYRFLDIGTYQGTNVWEWCMPQIETGSHATPYTRTSRSATASLIDLKRNTNINLSSVSFNSTGQPTFDGTDDEINTGITTQLTDFSCVVIFKDGGSAAWGRLVDKQYTTGFFISSYFATVGTNYVGAGVIEPNSPHGQALQYTTGKYNYFVLTRSGSTHTIYLNGSTNKLQKTNGSSATLSSTEMAIGAWNGSTATQRYTGEIPVVKLYNKELTAAEIQQDFEAYKNRFNL